MREEELVRKITDLERRLDALRVPETVVKNSDAYLMEDGGGMFQRSPNHWLTPTDHFNAFAGYTWAAYAPFDDAPSTVDVAAFSSLLRLVNNDTTEDHYCYKAFSGTGMLIARLCKGRYSYVGIRLQNSDNDNDDFVELKLIDGTTVGTVAIQRSYQTGGGGITNTTLLDNLPAMFYLLGIYKDGAGNHSCYYYIDAPHAYLLGAAIVAGWTGARAGIVFGQRTFTSSGYGAHVDWIAIP